MLPASRRPLQAATWDEAKLAEAAGVLESATASGRVRAASLVVSQGGRSYEKAFGKASSADTIFLLASISKPMTSAAVMVLHDRGELRIEDPVRRFIPEFHEGSRAKITLRQLLTHTSGLPDQLPRNAELRKRHAPLGEFVERAIRTPLLFEPGTEYRYSSMGVLLASEIARRITKTRFRDFLANEVFLPLGMKRTALGLGRFKVSETARCQVENAAEESGAGDPSARAWDWNSRYWRDFGAPWGGVHASARDVARFLESFLHPDSKILKPATVRLMLRDHNRGLGLPRGLGFALGTEAFSPACSERCFGHGGSTGTIAWADPASEVICVVLTTLPSRAAKPHPREVVSDLVAEATA